MNDILYKNQAIDSTYEEFNPLVLVKHFFSLKMTRKEEIDKDFFSKVIKKYQSKLVLACDEYLKKHPELSKSFKRPSGYMLSEMLSKENRSNILTFSKNKECKIHRVRDIELLLIIFGSTENGLYIPKKEIFFSETSFNSILYFPKEEVML